MAAADGDELPGPRWLWYAASLLIPIIGLVLGIYYGGKPDPERKRFGKNCLLAAAITTVTALCCGVLYIFFGIGGLLGRFLGRTPSL